MVLVPESREELARALAAASASKTPVSRVDLRRLNALVEHTAEDMTATVEAGMTLDVFQKILAQAKQWLPIDPPHAESLTLANLLAHDLSGPRRFGYGTIRDYLIGIRVALANGEVIKAGGKVVKNVAGYDLCKLFIGAKHSLGAIVEATFKLRPQPERETIVQRHCGDVRELGELARQVLNGPAEPVILDAHNLEGALSLVVGFAGPQEDVDYQLGVVGKLGSWTAASTEYSERFANEPGTLSRISVLPSTVAAALEKLGSARFVARIGNGVIYHRGASLGKGDLPNARLQQRVKATYDPNGIFPAYEL